MSILAIQHIERTHDVLGGKPRIAGHRIAVQDIVGWHYTIGWTTEQISAELGLSLGQVHAALSYYHDHRDEIDKAIRDDQVYVNHMRDLEEGRLADG